MFDNILRWIIESFSHCRPPMSSLWFCFYFCPEKEAIKMKYRYGIPNWEFTTHIVQCSTHHIISYHRTITQYHIPIFAIITYHRSCGKKREKTEKRQQYNPNFHRNCSVDWFISGDVYFFDKIFHHRCYTMWISRAIKLTFGFFLRIQRFLVEKLTKTLFFFFFHFCLRHRTKQKIYI